MAREAYGPKKTVFYAGRLDGECPPMIAELEVELKEGPINMYRVNVVLIHWLNSERTGTYWMDFLQGRHFTAANVDYNSASSLPDAVEHMRARIREEMNQHFQSIDELLKQSDEIGKLL